MPPRTGEGKNLTFVVKNMTVVVKGSCDNFPCGKDSVQWRCPSCTAALVRAYKTIIEDLTGMITKDNSEVDMRRRQVEEMRVVVDAANRELPILQEKTREAQEEAKTCRNELEVVKLRMQDLEGQLELAKTDTVADKLKDAEDELRLLRTELADVRHKLGKETLSSAEAKKQQKLSATDLKNYRKYIKTSRDKEKYCREELGRVQKRLKALGLEMSKRDDQSTEMHNRIDELSRASAEAIKHQDDMQHQNEGLYNAVQQLSIALESACEVEAQLRKKAAFAHNENLQLQEQISQLSTILSFQRNETQSTKALLAREKVLRKKAEDDAKIMANLTGNLGRHRAGLASNKAEQDPETSQHTVAGTEPHDEFCS